MTIQRSVAILLFDDAEDLDFSGPMSVFSMANRGLDPEPFSVFTIAEKRKTLTTRHGLTVTPAYTFENHPAIDILIIPGGLGARREAHNDVVKEWIRKNTATAGHLLSVCTGALLTGAAGLLNGLQATTHHSAFDKLQEIAPAAIIVRNKRFVDNGKIIVAAGVTAGIDAALYMVGKLVDKTCAVKVADVMEYHPQQDGQ
jgi:transcriptional regulator GlxA family with amidase domain